MSLQSIIRIDSHCDNHIARTIHHPKPHQKQTHQPPGSNPQLTSKSRSKWAGSTVVDILTLAQFLLSTNAKGVVPVQAQLVFVGMGGLRQGFQSAIVRQTRDEDIGFGIPGLDLLFYLHVHQRQDLA